MVADAALSPFMSPEAKVNLILFNPHAGTLFSASDPDQVSAFRDIVIQVGSLHRA